ncbi:MAG: 50S ribosomal protein L35 [Gaiellaceae bacterium]
MPKQKRHSGAKKRFRVSGTGKILRRRAMRSHLLGKKSAKKKRHLGKDVLAHASDVPGLKKLLK